MHTLIKLLTVAFGLGLLLAESAAARRYGLVVGVNKYENLGPDMQLKKAVSDARAIADALSDVGFEVSRVEDARRTDISKAWSELQAKITPGDTAVFFFAGHGVEIDGRNYLLPADVPRLSERDVTRLRDAAILFDQLSEDLQRKKVKVAIFILDACRDNPFRNNQGRSLNIARGLATSEAKGSFVMYSAGQGQTALDRLTQNDPDPNSVFTRNLLPQFREPGLSLPEMARRVRSKVVAMASEAGYTQVPAYYDNIDGDFSFRPLGDPAVSVQPGSGQSFVDRLDSGSACAFCPTMVVAPAGEFTMGSPPEEVDRVKGPREEQRKVRIERPFAVGRYAVTFEEWDACVADHACNAYKPHDEGWGRGRRPVINVSWTDAKAYTSWLSLKTGRSYRLLSKTEREYVTRAGSTTAFWWGPAMAASRANHLGSEKATSAGGGWLDVITRSLGGARRPAGSPVPVDSLEGNRWGLFHVHGNVWEWTEDCWNDANSGNPGTGAARGTGDCGRRVIRGGAWDLPAGALRSANRFSVPIATREDTLGFRVARAIER